MQPERIVAAVAALACLALVACGCGAREERTFTPVAPGLDDPPFDRQVFEMAVVPVLEQRCALAACHGKPADQIPFSLAGDLDLDFSRTAGQVDRAEPEASPLLLKPLALDSSGVLHDAPTVFDDAADPDFLILASWAGARF